MTHASSAFDTDWSSRWLGGFCALGATGGQPVREVTYAAQPPLAALLTLPTSWSLRNTNVEMHACEAWSTALGGIPVLIVKNVARARELLLQAFRLRATERVIVPANITRPLYETIKRAGGRPDLVELTESIQAAVSGPAPRLIWHEPVAGLATPDYGWVDHSDTFPIPIANSHVASAALIIWGLHLSNDPQTSGALITFGDHAYLRAAVAANMKTGDVPDLQAALAQCQRWQSLANRQQTALHKIWRGLHEAAGLPLMPLNNWALAHGVAVRIPCECDVSTFYAYVSGENTPVHWLPMIRPIHYQAAHTCCQSPERLARWLLVPVGPDYTPEEIKQSVLGIAKAADYLGVRWYNQPARAREYAQMMTAIYGPEHEAYRPAFAL